MVCSNCKKYKANNGRFAKVLNKKLEVITKLEIELQECRDDLMEKEIELRKLQTDVDERDRQMNCWRSTFIEILRNNIASSIKAMDNMGITQSTVAVHESTSGQDNQHKKVNDSKNSTVANNLKSIMEISAYIGNSLCADSLPDEPSAADEDKSEQISDLSERTEETPTIVITETGDVAENSKRTSDEFFLRVASKMPMKTKSSSQPNEQQPLPLNANNKFSVDPLSNRNSLNGTHRSSLSMITESSVDKSQTTVRPVNERPNGTSPKCSAKDTQISPPIITDGFITVRKRRNHSPSGFCGTLLISSDQANSSGSPNARNLFGNIGSDRNKPVSPNAKSPITGKNKTEANESTWLENSFASTLVLNKASPHGPRSKECSPHNLRRVAPIDLREPSLRVKMRRKMDEN